MLSSLYIKNIALVSSLELNLDSNLTTITGETGAGKSVILKALSMTLGDRADSDMISYDEEQAEVSATFDISNNKTAQEWLNEQSIDFEENQCILRRIIKRNKPSKAFINGVAATASMLKSLSESIIEIQGQNQHHQVISQKWQQSVIDQWIKTPSLLDDIKAIFKEHNSVNKEIARLKENNVSEYEIENLLVQLKELEELSPVEGEYEQLDQDQREYHQLENTLQSVYNGLNFIDGDSANDITGIRSLLGSLEHECATVFKNSDNIDLIEEQINQLQTSLEEINIALSSKLKAANVDTQEVEKMESRLSQYFELSRRHKVAPEFLFTLYQDLQEKYDVCNNIDAHIAKLELDKKDIIKRYNSTAKKLNKERKDAGILLSKNVTTEIQQLGLNHGEFKINVEPLEKMTSSGSDDIFFTVAINKGASHNRLDKAASGGELSRIFLGIQIVLTQKHNDKTIIYDEIDTGIGGQTAIIVGEKLKKLAKSYQILCITHLAQVASFGQQQLQVLKEHKKDRTHVNFTLLSQEERIQEIARMLSGNVDDTALENAKSLLNQYS